MPLKSITLEKLEEMEVQAGEGGGRGGCLLPSCPCRCVRLGLTLLPARVPAQKRLAEANAQAATGDGAAGMTFGSAQMEMERP